MGLSPPPEKELPVKVREAAREVADPTSAMTPRFNLLFREFAHRFFRHFSLDPETVARLRALEERGSVVYVMRYASRLDYFLMNALFLREGLRLSAFANGLSFYYYRPLGQALRGFFRRRRLWGKKRRLADRRRAREQARRVSAAGQSMFLFLRTARLGGALLGRRAAVARGRRELDLLREVVRTVWDGEKTVHLVPVALFWRRGPRGHRRFLNLTYGAPTRPSDVAKITSFFLTYRDLAIRLGEPIDLGAFVAKRREEGERAIVRKVRRAILLFLYREERVVEGPTLKPPHRVQEEVLADPRVSAAISERANGRRTKPEAARAQAERIFREISANMNSTSLALLYAAVDWLFRRLFVGIDVRGLEKVADYARQHPVVLVPSHRSYFDFLILSWLFYGNHLVPPHIAARENMAFGPFGYLFRRVGAFFLRKDPSDPLYRAVFRAYVEWLVKQGFTQEFFIEGGRSRTGKSLMPRLGMLSWNIQGFIDSGRRDLFFVPVAISYERLVEEGAMVGELEGAEKKDESMLGLVRARKVLRRRFGSAFVNFGEPISLARALEGHRAAFSGDGLPQHAAARRAFTEALANEIVERINWAVVDNATSVAACALLGEPRRGMFRWELSQRMREVTELLRLQDVHLTPALAADESDFAESISFLLRMGLLKAEKDPRGEILYYEEGHRRALEVYRNSLLHFLMAPSLMACRLLRGTTSSELRRDLDFWLDLFYQEFYAPLQLVRALHVDAFLDYFERIGVLERGDLGLQATEKGIGYFRFLAAQTAGLMEAYYASFSTLLLLEEPATAKVLEKRAAEQCQRAGLLGEIQRPSDWSPVTFQNVLALLTRRGILERSEASAREASYARGPAFEELAGLRGRLAGALGPR